MEASENLESFYRDKTVLVTGHTGFKGGWLSTWLKALGAHVVGFSDRIPTSPSFFEAVQLSDSIVDIRGDIRDPSALAPVFAAHRPDIVFHLAAQPIVAESYADPVGTISTNVVGTSVILDQLRKVDWPVVGVIITSDKCYENKEWLWGYREDDQIGGKDPYSASKGAAELIFHAFVHSFMSRGAGSARVASARAGNVIGGGDWAPNRIVPDCIRAWVEGDEVELRSPRATRPWQHVLEPLSGYLAVAKALSDDTSIHGESFNFGPDATADLTVEEVVQILARNWKMGAASYHVDEGSRNFHEAGLLKLSCEKAKTVLSWRPRLGAQDGVRLTGEWYQAYYEGGGPAVMADLTRRQIEVYLGSTRRS